MHTLQFTFRTDIARGRKGKLLNTWAEKSTLGRNLFRNTVFGGYSELYEILVLTIFDEIPDDKKLEFQKIFDQQNLILRTDWGGGIDIEFWGTNTEEELEVVNTFLNTLEEKYYCFSHYLSSTGQDIYNAYETLQNKIFNT
jgi:hypothetical protein